MIALFSMSPTQASKPAKRPASEHESDNIELKRQKAQQTPASTLSCTTDKAREHEKRSPSEVFSRDNTTESMTNIDRYLERLYALPLPEEPDEREDITSELEAGSHMLLLEHTEGKNAKCRASKCLVEERGYGERISSSYRLRLYATRPSDAHWTQLEKPNIRFFHVSCFEAVGVDIAKYVTLQPERELFYGGYTTHHHHPAIVDWVTNKGKAFDAELYSGDYEAALEAYQQEIDDGIFRKHLSTCSGENCACHLPPVRPKSSDFFPEEPSERSLTDVLLHALGAGHLMPLSQRKQIQLLEVLGEVPASHTKAALAAAKQKESQNEHKDENEDGTTAEVESETLQPGD